ncbi:MAG: ABC transporter permease [Gemmatimonadota bacterium]|nr:ABC transporter permease [Gemmatimonadota bacterium]MDH4348252.1 ABC transporter permease [Gemmatimonadota bacterium]MDH5282365.1 ABC transporter permease [Gemmatimonadota bacterium]
MNVFLSATTVGLILAVLALGVVISYGVLRVVDLTVDGAFTAGAAVTGMLLVQGADATIATLAGGLAGTVCGLLTGLFQTRLRVPQLLAGMITTTGLYSINLLLLAGGNLPLAVPQTVFEAFAALAPAIPAEITAIAVGVLVVASLVVTLHRFFRSTLGLALLAVGDNAVMAESVGVNTGAMTVLGLGLANGLVALAGALFAQYQGFANVQMGLGMLVAGLASVVLGDSLLRARFIGRRLAGGVAGALIIRYAVAGALLAGLDASALKLLTAILLLAVLVLPDRMRQLAGGWRRD